MAAFGVTLSLTEKTPQQIIAYLEKMQQLQVSSVFSSLQIPGDDPGTLQDTLAQVGPLFRRQGLGLYTSSGAELEAAFTRMMIVCLTYSLDGTMAAMSGVNRGLGYSMLSGSE